MRYSPCDDSQDVFPMSASASSVAPRVTGIAALCVMLLGLVVAGAGWLIPVEIMQEWAYRRAPADDVYAQFEAVGRMEAIWWVLTWIGPVIGLLGMAFWNYREPVQRTLTLATQELWRATGSTPDASGWHMALAWVKRAGLSGTLLLALLHTCQGFWQRIMDWPVYRLHSGEVILPNISDSNRAVIRYLQASTPENSRIFVASDQKLFFLSYYLWPRRILHEMHPEAAHLIPRPNQQRQLPAYRLEDVPDSVIQAARPGFILEYYEGPDYVVPERNEADPHWVRFIREQQGDSSYHPPYTVVLQPVEERP